MESAPTPVTAKPVSSCWYSTHSVRRTPSLKASKEWCSIKDIPSIWMLLTFTPNSTHYTNNPPQVNPWHQMDKKESAIFGLIILILQHNQYKLRNCLNLWEKNLYTLILRTFLEILPSFVGHDARIAPSSTCKTHPKISSKSFAHKFKQFLKNHLFLENNYYLCTR